MLNLGLGALVKKEEPAQEVLSYEYLDTVMMYNEACEELTIVCDQFDQVCTAYENLIAISDVIKEHGVTPALEALVGENFVGGFSLEAAEGAKEGAWEKIKAFIKSVWQAIKNFFLKFFSTTDGLRKRLIAFKEKANAEGATVNVDKFTGIKAETLGNYSTNVKGSVADLKLSDQDIKKYDDQIGDVELGSDKDKAVAYADNLSKILSDFSNRKEEYLKIADAQIAAAEKLTDGTKDEEVAKAKNAKELISKTFKAVYSSAAGFLSHAKVTGGKDAKKDDAKPAEGDAKPAENAEAGKEGEGK